MREEKTKLELVDLKYFQTNGSCWEVMVKCCVRGWEWSGGGILLNFRVGVFLTLEIK